MKRDMDEVRRILLYVQEHDSAKHSCKRETDEAEQKALYHLKLCADGGLITDCFVDLHGGTLTYRRGNNATLTWKGHDLVDAIADDTVWKQTKSRLEKVGEAVSMATLKVIAGKVAEQLILGA